MDWPLAIPSSCLLCDMTRRYCGRGCQSMDETQMGRYKFSSWTLHMASIIIFISLCGIGLKGWKRA
jgi:hypothetical protein